jgi:hypothetical protein
MDEVLTRLHLIEEKLSELISLQEHAATEKATWIDSKAFCAAVGIKDKVSLHYYMSKGVIHGPALRNIGSTKRPRYRFHRVKAVDQFLNRARQ